MSVPKNESKKAKKGDKVKVEYEGRFEDGEIFDSTAAHGGTPLEFEAGAGRVVAGFDNAIIGMAIGESKEVTLPPTLAYGERNPQLVKDAPREMFPKTPEPKKGMMLMLTAPDGMQFPATIVEVNDKLVKLDLNHPLAGKTLIFKIKLAGIAN